MQRLTNKGILGGVILLPFLALSAHSQSTIYTMDANVFFDTSGAPIQTGGLTAIFHDVPGGVDLTLSVSGLGESYYSVNTWWFMTDKTYAGTLKFTEQSSTGSFTSPVLNQSATPTFEAGNGGYFNTSLNGWANFENGDSITYLITSSKSGLTAVDFDNLDSLKSGTYAKDTSRDSKGDYYTAAYVTGDTSSSECCFYLGATCSVVPEPGTSITIVGLALFGLREIVKRLPKSGRHRIPSDKGIT